MTYDWISVTTDYGLRDGFAAACHGVIARLAPAVRVIDVTHEVPPQQIRHGAMALAQTVPFLPESVHLAVVDPGVGTTRRGVVVVAERGLLVGPDNGLLLPAADVLGGVQVAYELTEPAFRLPVMARPGVLPRGDSCRARRRGSRESLRWGSLPRTDTTEGS